MEATRKKGERSCLSQVSMRLLLLELEVSQQW